MKKSMMSRVSAAAAAGMLLTTMIGMPVNAADESAKEATFTKNITKEENTYAPATVFHFTIEPGTAVDATGDAEAIYAGPVGGAVLADGTITSSPSAGDIGKTTVTAGTADITLDITKFSRPGIYRYVVKETAGEYDGVTYTTEEKNFDVYVTNGADGKLEIASYAFVSKDDNKVKDDGVFINDYCKTNDVTIKKEVIGNQGDKKKDFRFTIKVNGTEGEQYYVVFSDGRTPVTLTTGVAQTITLKHDQSAKIYGLSGNDTYTVTEDDYSSDGYTTTIGGTETNTDSGNISEDKLVTVVNDKDTITPTGIIVNIVPYILMVAIAAITTVLFFRRKREA